MLNKFRFGLIALAALALVLVVPHVFAQDTTSPTVEFTGTISAISADGLTLTVDGLVVDVAAAETDLTFEIGMVVKVDGTVLEDGTIAASEVSAPDTGDSSGDETTPTDTLELVGTLESLDAQTAVVSGMTFDVTGAEIGADVAVGETVKVHASLSEDGTAWLASEIELYQGEDTVGQDTSGDDNSDDMDEDNNGGTATGACTFTVDEESANLRSAPGTGSTVLGYAFEDQQFSVLETHTSGDWVKVSSSVGDAWIATSTGELSGDCSTLPVSSEAIVTGSSSNEGSDDSSSEVEDESGDDNSQGSVDDSSQNEQGQEDESQNGQQQADEHNDEPDSSTSGSSG